MMRFWIYIACCVLASGVFSKSIPSDERRSINLWKRSPQEPACCSQPAAPACCSNPPATPPPPESVCCDDAMNAEDEDDDEPKRLVVYFNFEKVVKKKDTGYYKILDKSGYENSGTMETGGEILKFNDKDYTCNQAARLFEHDICLRGDTFQAKPKTAITIAAWIKAEQKTGLHSIFNTMGNSHQQAQLNFEINEGVVRWFHRDEKQKVVFEAMGHTVPRDKWSHVAGTYDSKTKQAKIFINGVIANQSLGEGLLSRDWGGRASIGDKSKNRAVVGSVDEFRIYNYALKPDEIKALVSACRPVGSDAGFSTDNTDTAGGGDANANEAKGDAEPALGAEAKGVEAKGAEAKGVEGKPDIEAKLVEGKDDSKPVEGKPDASTEGKSDGNAEMPEQSQITDVKTKLGSGATNAENTAQAVVAEAPSPDDLEDKASAV